MAPPDSNSNQDTAPTTTGFTDRLNFAILLEQGRDILLKRWWILASCLLIAISIGVYQAYNQPDIYQARGSLMVSPKISVPVGPNAGDLYKEEMINFFGTSIRLIQSRQVLEAVRRKLADFEKTLPLPTGINLQVSREKETSIIQLTATSTSAEYAERFLAQVMEEFIQHRRTLREATSENVGKVMLGEMQRLEQETKQGEEELFKFQKAVNIPSVEANLTVTAQRIAALKQRLAELRTEIDLFDIETTDRQLQHMRKDNSGSENDGPGKTESGSSSQAPPAASAPSGGSKNDSSAEYQTLKNSISLLIKERDDLAKIYRPQHEKIKGLNQEIERKQQLLNLLQQETKDKILAHRKQLGNEEATLRKSLQEAENEALELNRKAAQYALLKSGSERTKELYGVLLNRYEQILSQTRLESDVIGVNERALASRTAIGPNRKRDVMATAFIGLVIAIAIMVALEKFDDRIKNVVDLRNLIDEMVLGQVPLVLMPSKGAVLMSNLPTSEMFSEALRNIHSSLMFSSATANLKTMVITSPFPGDGKSTIAVNLAICFSQLKPFRTLLVDMDLRRMCVHKYFNIPNSVGAAEILSGKLRFEDCVVSSGLPNLDILCAGRATQDPSELVLSDQFRELVDLAAGQYDRVVFDTSPVLVTDDALCLASIVGGVILVFRVNRTATRFIHESIEHVKRREAKVLGVVLNGIDISRAQYYYYNYYYRNYYQRSHATMPAGPPSAMPVSAIRTPRLVSRGTPAVASPTPDAASAVMSPTPAGAPPSGRMKPQRQVTPLGVTTSRRQVTPGPEPVAAVSASPLHQLLGLSDDQELSIQDLADRGKIRFKIAYYGPALGGKTANLMYLHSQVESKHKSDSVSLVTAADQALFFDFLPLSTGVIKGFETTCKLYTVPEQGAHNPTRQSVLHDVDGIVFVADSQWEKIEGNVESFKNLESDLAEQNLALDDIPYVFQYNKRDITDVAPVRYLEYVLNNRRVRVPSFEAAASLGQNVFAALNAVCRLLIQSRIKYSQPSTPV